MWAHSYKSYKFLSKSTKDITAEKIIMPRCPFGTAVEVPKSVPNSVMNRVTKSQVLQTADHIENVGTWLVNVAIGTSYFG